MRRAYTFRATGLTSNGGYEYIKMPRVKPGESILIREVRYSNKGTATQNPQLVLNPDGEALTFDVPEGVATGNGYTFQAYMWLGEEDVLCLRITGSGFGGYNWAQFSGWIYDQCPDVVEVIQPAAGAKPNA